MLSEDQVLALAPDFSRVLPFCRTLGELFILVRNESCVLGALAEPLHYSKIGSRRMAWMNGLTLNLSARQIPSVLAYNENGEHGEIQGIEFFDGKRRGCFKICRTNEASRKAWGCLLRDTTMGYVPRETLQYLRKTNSLSNSWCCDACRRRNGQEPLSKIDNHETRVAVEAFFHQAIHDARTVQMRVPCGLLRASGEFTPVSLEWKKDWLFAISPIFGCHLYIGDSSTARFSERPGGLRLMDIFDHAGKFVARFCSRPKFTS